MIIALLVLSGLLVSSLLILLARFHRKIRRQAKQLFLQGQEIKKHLLELQQQNNQLAELNKEKQHLFSVVSHDFKGPFNRIFALVQLLSLSGDALTDEQRDYLGKIHLIVADGLNMLRNLLDNRKLEEKGIELRPETLNVTAVIASLIKNYSVIAAKKKIQIHSEAPPRLFLVMDKACLTRITDNLISNAIKFSPPQRQVWVSVRDEGGIVEIRVKDEGPGVTRNDHENLFQKYRHLTAKPTGGETSTGLGLYLIVAMINKMKGEILCISEEGQGATFVVRLRALTDD